MYRFGVVFWVFLLFFGFVYGFRGSPYFRIRGFGVYGVFGRSLVIGFNCRRPKVGRSIREFYRISFSFGS